MDAKSFKAYSAGVAVLITALTGLSLGVLNKYWPEEPVASKSYLKLSREVEGMSRDLNNMYDQIHNLAVRVAEAEAYRKGYTDSRSELLDEVKGQFKKIKELPPRPTPKSSTSTKPKIRKMPTLNDLRHSPVQQQMPRMD